MELEANRDIKISQTKAGIDIDKQKELDLHKKNAQKKRKQLKRKIEELKQKLNKFDDMIAEGKISEDIYKIRVNRIENELKNLENKL